MRRASLAAAIALAACSQDVGEPGVWVPADEIVGTLQPELAAALMRSPQRLLPDRLRIVTWNVEYGKDVEGLAAYLQSDRDLASAGIILLQEEESHPDEDGSRPERLAQALGMDHVYAPEREKSDGGTHGVAILSAYPLENVAIMVLPFVDLPFSGRHRIALAADVRLDDGVVRLITTHLDTRLNVTDRIMQLRPAIIDAPERVVVGGDLNTNTFIWTHGQLPLLSVESVADSDQAPILDDYMRHLGFETPTAELGPTQKAGGVLDLRLDHIYTRGLAVVPGVVERNVSLSDHWPLWVDVELR